MSSVDETSVSSVDETVRVDRLKEANLFVDIKKKAQSIDPRSLSRNTYILLVF